MSISSPKWSLPFRLPSPMHFSSPPPPMLPFLCKSYEQSTTVSPTPLPKLPLNTLHKNRNNKVSVFKLALCHSNLGSKHLITLFQLNIIKNPQNSENILRFPHNHNLQCSKQNKYDNLWYIIFQDLCFLLSCIRLTMLQVIHYQIPHWDLHSKFLGWAVTQTTLKPHGLF